MQLRRKHLVGTACLTIALFAAAPSAACSAQSPQELDALTKSLPAMAKPALLRLADLNRLPEGEWRTHTGDVAHGERTDLDDSTWPIAKPGTQYSAEALWFRQWVQIPTTLQGYDLTGTRIWFSFRARLSGDGSINEIVYFNGRRVALGESLEDLILFNGAKPGDRVLVAVKLLATDGKKQFQSSTKRVEFAENRPNPQDFHDEIIAAAELIPSLSQNVPADEAALGKAMQHVDIAALDGGDQKKFDASLTAAEASLATLKPLLAQATMHLTGNAHIDAAWLWPASETVDVVKRTFSTALQLMDEYPKYTYTQSAAAYNDWMADKYPLMETDIKQRIKEGRWEVLGGMWVEPDLNIPDGESTVRSILLGKRWFLQHYGVDVRIGWNPDSFGYNWQLPQIYKKSGIDFFVTQKMSWNDTNKLPLKLFWWQSPDGSKVLTYFPHNYTNSNMNPVRLVNNLVEARTMAPGMTELMDLYGVGDHGGGPTRDMLDEANRWMQPGKVAPKMEFGTALSYFAKIEKQIAPGSKTWDYRTIAQGYQFPASPPAGEISIPTWNDELYLEYHRGVFTTQAAIKRSLRQAPEWTTDAEKYASLAWLDGDPYPNAELTDAWKKIAFTGFHDLAAGSGIAVIYRDAQKDFDGVRWETHQISSKALKTLAARIDTRSAAGVPVLIFNPLAWQRSATIPIDVQMPTASSELSVLDAHGAVLPSEILSHANNTTTYQLLVAARNLPSMGYSVVQVVPGKRTFTTDLKATETTLENATLRVVIDPKTGCITSLYDKKAAFEALARGSCGNQLQAFQDTPSRYDAWNIDPGTLDKPPSLLMKADSVKLIHSGPLRASITVIRTWQASKFIQTISLDADGDEVRVDNDIDWHETHVLLKTAFALSTTAPFATYEIPFGSIERPTTRNNTWEQARFEVPAQHWADLSGQGHGLSLLNDSKFGYDAAGNTLRLTLLRSPTSPDADADRGPQHFSFALYPHAGDWKQAMTVQHGYEFNYNLDAEQTEAHTGIMPSAHSFTAASSSNVVVTAMKKAEDSNALIFHLYEWVGKDAAVELKVPQGATSAVETNLMENGEGPALPLKSDHLTIPVHPFEIVTVRVNYPDRSN